MKLGFKFNKKEKEAPPEEIAAEPEVAEEPAADIITDVDPVKPHAPLQELSLDAGAGSAEGGQELPLDAGGEEQAETIKLAEIQLNPEAAVPPPPPPPPSPAPQPPPPPAPVLSSAKDPGKKNDPLDLGSSIGNIFNNIEDEENPLANLIKSLPDVAATELIDDLKEINDIIKDWQKK